MGTGQRAKSVKERRKKGKTFVAVNIYSLHKYSVVIPSLPLY
jgi:hypothetical protein